MTVTVWVKVVAFAGKVSAPSPSAVKPPSWVMA